MIFPFLLLVATGAGADSTPAVRFVPAGDSVVVFVVSRPRQSFGFVVYRGPVGGSLTRVTPRPVTPARDGAEAAGIMGPDFTAVARAVRAIDAEAVLRRLESDPFSAAVLSGLYRGVAQALGRLYVDGGVVRGASYTYRVVFTDADGRESTRAVTATVVVRDVRPAAPRSLSVATSDHQVTLRWSYPRSAADSVANTIAFVVYRADGAAGTFRRVSTPLIRNDATPPAFVDPDAENGVSYRYAVAAVDLIQREGALSAPASAVTADRTPPDPVSGLAAVPSEGLVTLAWRRAPEPDAAGYQVERARRQNGPFARITTALIAADHPTYTDTAAGGASPYFYRILTQDRSGNVSAPSTSVEVLPVDRTPPVVPSAVRVEARGRHLTIRWHASPSRDVLGYNIYRGEAGADRLGSKLVATPLADTTFVDSGRALRPGRRYVVSVSAVDSAQNESPRASATVLIPDDAPPPPPTGLMARDVGGRFVDVLWSASGAFDVARYELARSAGDSAPQVLARLGGPPPYAVRDTGAVRGRAYVYRVIAVDSAGNRSLPAMDTLRFTRPTPPPAPRHVAVRAAGSAVTVLWERVVDPELAGYRVYRSALPTGAPSLVGSTAAGATSLIDPHGAPAFYYWVRAVDRSGNESASSPAARAGGGTP